MEERTARRTVVGFGIGFVLLGLILLIAGFFIDALVANISFSDTKYTNFPFSLLTPVLGALVIFTGVMVLKRKFLGYWFALAVPPVLFLFVVFNDLNAKFWLFVDSAPNFLQQPTGSLLLHVIEGVAIKFHTDPVTGAYSLNPLYFCYFLVVILSAVVCAVFLRNDIKSLFEVKA